MADDGKIVISIELDDGTVKKGFLNIENAAKDSFNKIKKAGDDKPFGGLDAALGGLKAQLLAIGAVIGGALFSKEAIDSAIEQENAINKVSTALKLAGTFSNEALQNFEAFSQELQKTTTISDEAALSAAALARNFTQTNDQAIALTKAAQDLAAATGKDLESAVDELGKTFSGSAGRLSKFIPQLQGLTEAQLRAGDAIALVQKRFEGAAAAQTNTFQGALTQTKNAFDDVLEAIGGIIVKSPAAVAIIKKIGEAFAKFAESIAEFTANRDLFGTFIVILTNVGKALTYGLIAPFEYAINLQKIYVDGFQTLVRVALQAIVEIANGVANILDLAGISNQFTKAINQVAKDGRAAIETSFGDVKKDFSNVFSFDITDQSLSFLNSLQTLATEAQPIVEGLQNATGAIGQTFSDNFIRMRDELLKAATDFSIQFPYMKDQVDQFGISLQDLNTLSEAQLTQLKTRFAEFSSAVQGTVSKVSSAIGQGLVSAVSAGAQRLGASLIKGKASFADFGSAIFDILGNIAIQCGEAFLAIGLGVEAIRDSIVLLAGGPAIAAGLALIVLGGLLKALSGGGGGGSASASSGGGGSTSTASADNPAASNPTVQDQKPQSLVTVNIQGDVLDSSDTSLRIVDLIKSYTDKNGNTVFQS